MVSEIIKILIKIFNFFPPVISKTKIIKSSHEVFLEHNC